uniref:Cytochrome b561 domain-containing protein n=1 Tax=Aureoumbra lagunensis TaxID=44058 RepID=A0A7S3NL95_9STRA|mmetsp:Transcript_8655/g.12019  ORF Transcript_8655/g.12019 Transcript_8655/m.12019 type:complete len:209 (+) Transcript_8655:37-663(+)
MIRAYGKTLLFLFFWTTQSFVVIPQVQCKNLHCKRIAPCQSILQPLEAPLTAYADLWIPMFKSMSLPDWLVRWGHPAAMTSVLLSMGLYGSFLGFQIKSGKGSEVLPLSLGQTSRDMHPKVMAGAFFFFALGGQGGLVLNRFLENESLQSSHAVTAFTCLALLAIQSLLPTLFPTFPSLRNVHTYVGSFTLALLFLHAFFGLQLGFSF